MQRAIWALLAVFGLAVNSGCMLCQDCFDYAYPAHGGCCHWEADDCCRAGSAFCHVIDGGFAPGGPTPAIHDPVPEPLPYDASRSPEDVVPEVLENEPAPPPTDLAPPIDITPPTEFPDTGLPPLDDLDLPPLRDPPLQPNQDLQ